MKRLEEIKERLHNATPGPWEEGGPYPGASVIVMTDMGCTNPDACPEPPSYEPIAILDSKQKGEPNPQSISDRAFIANSRQDLAWAVKIIEAGIKMRSVCHPRCSCGAIGSYESINFCDTCSKRFEATEEWDKVLGDEGS